MPIIRKNPECISCIIKKYVDQYPEGISREEKIKYMERVLLAVANSDIEEAAPQITERVYQIQREMFGSVKDLSHVKSYFNQNPRRSNIAQHCKTGASDTAVDSPRFFNHKILKPASQSEIIHVKAVCRIFLQQKFAEC